MNGKEMGTKKAEIVSEAASAEASAPTRRKCGSELYIPCLLSRMIDPK